MKKTILILASVIALGGALTLILKAGSGAGIGPGELAGKWCQSKGEGYLILKSDGSFTKDGSAHEAYRWSFKSGEDPLGPALAFEYYLNGVFPLSRNDGRLVFVVEPDENAYYGKCD